MTSVRRTVRPSYLHVALPLALLLVPFAWDHDMSLGITVLFACVALAVTGLLVPRPYLRFDRGLRATSAAGVTVPPGGLWTVPITNAGDAMGRVVAVRHAIEIEPDADGRGGGRAEGDAAAVCAVLSEGWVDDRDFLFVRLSPGTALAAGESLTLFELPLALARRLVRLDTWLTVQGRDGRRTELTIAVLPPHGLPRDRADTEPARA